MHTQTPWSILELLAGEDKMLLVRRGCIWTAQTPQSILKLLASEDKMLLVRTRGGVYGCPELPGPCLSEKIRCCWSGGDIANSLVHPQAASWQR